MIWPFTRKQRYVFHASNRLQAPFDEVDIEVHIFAETRLMAIDAATQFGFKHHLLLTGPK